jgi:hypothetical protein
MSQRGYRAIAANQPFFALAMAGSGTFLLKMLEAEARVRDTRMRPWGFMPRERRTCVSHARASRKTLAGFHSLQIGDETMSRLLIAVLAASLVGGSALSAAAADAKKPRKSPAERFASLDANKDEKLTAEEFISKRKNDDQKKAGSKRFKKLDKDKDGSLTLEEFKTPVKPKKK